MSPNELLISLLTDAYATEMKVIHTLEQHIEGLDRFPELRDNMQEHLTQSRSHSNMIEQCLKRLGGEVSNFKVTVGEASGFLQSASSAASADAVLSNLMNDYAAEHFEMALYNILIAVAQELGDAETAEICRTILSEEVEMAKLLNDSLPALSQEYIRNLGN